MATNADSFPITPAMIAPAWVKPTVSFYTVAGGANATDDFLPKTLAQRAGCPGGTGSAVIAPLPPGQLLDPNYAFAIAAEGPAVDTNPTLSVTNVES